MYIELTGLAGKKSLINMELVSCISDFENHTRIFFIKGETEHIAVREPFLEIKQKLIETKITIIE